MAKLVLGIGTSHTPMLNAPAEDWPRFIDRDGVRDFLDKRDGFTSRKRKEAYDNLSRMGAHPTVLGFVLLCVRAARRMLRQARSSTS